MSAKNVIDVIIDGKIYTIGGFESEAYLQKLATYISSKILEFKQDDAYRRQKIDTQKTLLEINIADDYFKAKKQADFLQVEIEELKPKLEINDLKLKNKKLSFNIKNIGEIRTKVEAYIEEKDKENYDLKHDLITADMKIESLEAQLQEAKDKNIELQKEIVKLQTELKNKK